MRSGAADYQSPDDEAEIEALMSDDAPSKDVTATAVVESSQEAAPTEQPAKDEVFDVDASPKKGDPRAALRASRTAEHRANREVSRLREEIEALKKAAPTPPPEDDSLTAEELAQAAEDFPMLAKLARQTQAVTAEVQAMRSMQTSSFEETAAPEFAPPTLPFELQNIVDDIPALLSWQNDPDQAAFEMAKMEDQKLLIHPNWKGRPVAERLAEVARRVSADLTDAAPRPTTPRVNVDDAIANAPRVKPNTLGDIGGGGESPKSASNLGRYSQMSDEDIESELLSG